MDLSILFVPIVACHSNNLSSEEKEEDVKLADFFIHIPQEIVMEDRITIQ
jgi:hypothetical protein